MTVVLKVENLQVSYGRIQAVRGISLDVEAGGFVGIVGANGAGKSSTLHAITGVVPTAGGSVVFDGAPITGQPPEMIVRRGLCLVPEGRMVFTRLTVEENLRLAAGTVRNRDPQAMHKVFARFPVLERYRATPAGRLSGGEQQQLVIGRALLTRPKLLMLDEPSLGLAPLLVEEVFSILADLCAEGTTILLVEQNAAKTIQTADRTWVMTNGKADLIEQRDAASTQAELIAAYLGERRTHPT
jgi:branched-chain amino acid transport system ATP-binding protein